MMMSSWARFSARVEGVVRPSRRVWTWTAALPLGLLLAGAPGCGGSQKTDTNSAATAEIDWGLGNIDRSRCSQEGKKVVTADTNKDSKPDIWKFYGQGKENGQEVQVLACKQVDLNQDGKVDLVDHYGSDGQVEMTEMDFDFDGRFDQTDFYKGGKKLRQERDMDFDNKPDYVVFYEAGKTVRIERDSDGNGRVDEWHYYEDGKLDRIGYDTNGSGKADKWDRSAEEAAAAAGGAAAPAPAATDGTEPPPAP